LRCRGLEGKGEERAADDTEDEEAAGT
jgi:hypothetical protein